MTESLKSTGAVALLTTGIASAFALATCCAFPILLGGAAAGLAPIAVAAEPHSQLLTAVSVVGLLGSAGLAARVPRNCKPNSICARPWFRWGIISAAAVGTVLLILAKVYA